MHKKSFKDILKKKLTLMVIPHTTESHIIQIKLPVTAWVLILGVIFSLFGYGIMIAVKDIDYKLAKESSSAFNDKARFLVQKAKNLEEKEKKLGELEVKLREILAYKSKKSIVQEKGLGGPSRKDQSVLENLLSEDVSKQDIEKEYDRLMTELDLREKSSKEVFKYVSQLRSVWAATPKGRPVKGWITSRFGAREAVFNIGGKEYHMGVDIANRMGTPIHATADGKVIFAGRMGGYGNLVILEHEFGFTTRFGHCSRILVKRGQKVKIGETIALVGSTGSSTGPHVHYEIRRYGQATDPKIYEPDFYSPYYARK